VSRFATRLSKYLLITTALLLLAQLAVPAQAQTQITSCGTVIDAPGNYVLANDLNCPGIDGIDITASNVTLELNNHQITGYRMSYAGLAVFKNNTVLSHVTINGPGTITNFMHGVFFYSQTYGSLSRITCTGNYLGFLISGPGSEYNLIENNTANLNQHYGFQITSPGGIYGYNQANQNGDAGFLLAADDAQANALGSNTADQNTYGIVTLPGAAHNLISGNSAHGNSAYDLSELNYHLFDCTNIWQRDNFGTRNKECIH